MMSVKHIGGISLCRPRRETEGRARIEAEKHLRSAYAPGKYEVSATINDILQHQFGHFDRILHLEIEEAASSDLLQFLLGQYDATSAIEDKKREASCRTMMPATGQNTVH